MTFRLRRTLVGSVLAAAAVVGAGSWCGGGASISRLPMTSPKAVRTFHVAANYPWGTGAYGAIGQTLYWFYRVDPANPDRRGGTLGYDNAPTSVWELAALRNGKVVPLARYRSRFAGAVLMSELRGAPWGSLYVAISGHDGSTGGIELVELGASGTTRLVWSGPYAEWPKVLFDEEDILVDSDYQIARISRTGDVRQILRTELHTTACVWNGDLLINELRQLGRPGDASAADLGGWAGRGRDRVCRSSPSGFALVSEGFMGMSFASIRGSNRRRVRLSGGQAWNLQNVGGDFAVHSRGAAHTLILDEADAQTRIQLPASLADCRIAPGTTSQHLFLVLGDGYCELQR